MGITLSITFSITFMKRYKKRPSKLIQIRVSEKEYKTVLGFIKSFNLTRRAWLLWAYQLAKDNAGKFTN